MFYKINIVLHKNAILDKSVRSVGKIMSYIFVLKHLFRRKNTVNLP